MLDPRIYRTGLVAVAVALILFAFSLGDQPHPLTTNLAPESFNGQNAFATMRWLAEHHPDRRPGSGGDRQAAAYVGSKLSGYHYAVSESTFSARTALGTRTLTNVTGVLAGQSSAPIVVVAPRDALDSAGTTELSGTGALIELARVLAGQTMTHTVIIASISGSMGGAGAAELARSLPRPVDAVLVLGDLATDHQRQPFVIPWSRGQAVAPAALRNTVAGAIAAQSPLANRASDLGGQLLHLAFPMTLSDQAPFNDVGAPAVEISLAGERVPPGGAVPTGSRAVAAQATLSWLGRALLQTVTAIDGGPQLARPSTYLIYSGKVIPAWAIRLLVLALIFPVAVTTVDAVARVRRRGHALLPWIAWVLGFAAAFLLAGAVVVLARIAGLLSGDPAGPVPSGAPGPDGGGLATIAVAGLVLLVTVFVLRPRLSRVLGAGGLRRGGLEGAPGAAVAVSVVLCLTTLVLWLRNPFAALLLVPALHLWLWLGASELHIARPWKLLLVLVGLAPVALAVLYYALGDGLSATEVLWNGVLIIAAGQLGTAGLILWSMAFGCFAGVIALALAPARRRRVENAPVTVRGPISYAGPGSLGGTESALRR